MRRLLLFALPFGAGVALCLYLLPGAWWLYAAAGGGLAGLALSRLWRKKRRQLAVMSLGFALGALWLTAYAQLYLAPAQALVGQEGTFALEVLDYPEITDYGLRLTVRVEGVRGKAVYYGDESLSALVPGNTLTVTAGCASAQSLSGDESDYYTARGVFLRLYGRGEAREVERGRAGSLRYLPCRLAHRLRGAVERCYGGQAGGLITAILTGSRDGLDEQSISDLEESGLMHVTAVSGLHCGFLIGLLGLLLGRSRYLTALVGYPVLLVYMAAVGCTPSVVRSCVMIGFLLLAPLAGRESDPPTALAGALLVILLANPFAVASVSLQLSFAAVAGLLWVSPAVYRGVSRLWRPRGRGLRWAWNGLCASLAASLGALVFTAPISALYFGALPLLSPLSNLLALGAASALFSSALMLTPLAAAVPALLPLTALPGALARYTLWLAGLVAHIPGHGVYFVTPGAAVWLAGTYAMGLVCVLLRPPRRVWALAAALSALCLVTARELPRLSVRGARLVVAAVDVGQGAAAVLAGEEGAVLVDCGSLYVPRGPGSLAADTLDTYGWDRLEAVVLTHYHEDHAGGLAELLARVEVGQLLLPQLSENGGQADLQREVLALAERYRVPVRFVEEPARLPLGEACLTVYPPLTVGQANEEGLTVLCTAGDFDVLATGDMAAATERLLTETYSLPDVEVLLVGHHGSAGSTSDDLLDAVTPEVGIISVGEHNAYGHPSAEAMDRMARRGMTLYRTDRQGTILVRVRP